MRRKRSILATSLLLVLTFLVLEGIARLAFSAEPVFRLVAGDDEASWRQRWIFAHRHRAESDGAASGLATPMDQYDPLLGWVTRPGLENVELWGGKYLNTTPHGLRGRVDPAFERTSDAVRLLVLGDSFTFGEEVSDDEVWCARLAASMPGVEVINLGVHGYGHDQMLLHYRETGRRYDADAVVLGFVDYDVSRNLNDFRDYAKPYFVLRDGALELRGVPVPTPEEILTAPPPPFFLPEVLSRLKLPVQRMRTSKPLLHALLDALIRDVRAAGALPVLIDLPTGKTLAADTWQRQIVGEMCREKGVPGGSLRPWVAERIAEGESFPLAHRHWDADGHRLVAEGVRALLLREGVVQCPATPNGGPCAPGPALAPIRAAAATGAG
jgi:hypothetical protein